MTRIKRGITTRARHKKILARAKGYKLGRSKLIRQAKQAVIRAGQHSYRHRRTKKRDFRRLWIVQINAALKKHDMAYKDFIFALSNSGIELNRKVLAELSIKSPEQFSKIVQQAKSILKLQSKISPS